MIATMEKIEALLADPKVSWDQTVEEAGTCVARLIDAIRAKRPDLVPALIAKKERQKVNPRMRPTVDRAKARIVPAVVTAGLDPAGSVTANALRLTAATMMQVDDTSLPYGAWTALQEVLAENGCIPATSGSLRCYRLRLLKEADDLHHQHGLPDGFLKWLTGKTLA
ncbi:hypothetical protein GCM10010873_18000 [Cypionkella aquatica]|uniref:Uncharacterized protein n=1 Tax=Cypionkella aquatica TaxID=1756042 RepID=A0AA37X3H9_9RHOB|nr:hypothetical protein [Cypionkella aquatica]GLS86826.1 hypothetical protein GCM10010873_18000 [Cypionkella aquatica]